MPATDHPWIDVDLDPITIDRLIAWVSQARNRSGGRFARGYLSELPGITGASWFVLKPQCPDWPINRDEDGVEIVWSYRYPRVSDRIVEVARQHALNGVRFVPDSQKHRFRRRRQWFDVVPTTVMGRGVDHLWVDPQTLKGNDHGQPVDPKERHGITHFKNNQLYPDTPTMPGAFRNLTRLFPPGELTFNTAPRVLKRHLPATDFALLPSDPGTCVCFNARARSALTANALLGPADYFPLIVLDEPEPNQLAFDDPVDEAMIPSLPNSEPSAPDSEPLDYQWTFLDAVEAVRRQFTSTPAIGCHGPIDPRQLADAVQKIGLPLPELWRVVMLAVGEWGCIGACSTIAPKRWPEDHARFCEMLDNRGGDRDKRFLFVGGVGNGDQFALELPAVNSPLLDAPMLLYDHELSAFTMRWPSITRYLEEHLR
ncbi:MAG: hypothetical protein JWP03_1262 [Phycisphaerales bacterium]|nr:hypothetical protein [Phycisphaerales bacterium]